MELITELRRKLIQAKRTESGAVRRSACGFVSPALHYLRIQRQWMLAVQQSLSHPNSLVATKLVQGYCRVFPFEYPIYVSLREGYMSTGSFVYYKRVGLKPRKEYFAVSLDVTDPLILWPLVVHELAHCWLSHTDHVDRISSSLLETFNGSYSEPEDRVEEAVCDAVATRLTGAQYPLAFAMKLWLDLPSKETGYHPFNSFRLELMAQTLDDMHLFEEAGQVRDIAATSSSSGWNDEPISPSLQALIHVAKGLPPYASLAHRLPCNEAINRSWANLYNGKEPSLSRIKVTSNDLKNALEGWTMPTDA